MMWYSMNASRASLMILAVYFSTHHQTSILMLFWYKSVLNFSDYFVLSGKIILQFLDDISSE